MAMPRANCRGLSSFLRRRGRIWKSALLQTSHHPLMCKYLSTSLDAPPLCKTNGANTALGEVFFPPPLYSFAVPKLWLHMLQDAWFSRVVSSAQDLIRSVLFLQDKLTGAIKAHSILKYSRIFVNACTHVHVRVNTCTWKSTGSLNNCLYWLNGTSGSCWDLWGHIHTHTHQRKSTTHPGALLCFAIFSLTQLPWFPLLARHTSA